MQRLRIKYPKRKDVEQKQLNQQQVRILVCYWVCVWKRVVTMRRNMQHQSLNSIEFSWSRWPYICMSNAVNLCTKSVNDRMHARARARFQLTQTHLATAWCRSLRSIMRQIHTSASTFHFHWVSVCFEQIFLFLVFVSSHCLFYYSLSVYQFLYSSRPRFHNAWPLFSQRTKQIYHFINEIRWQKNIWYSAKHSL